MSAIGIVAAACSASVWRSRHRRRHPPRIGWSRRPSRKRAPGDDGSYRRIAYPGGDVPESIGVCTDVVIRAYRRVGIDLQVKVHEDMKRAFRTYPQLWGMSGPIRISITGACRTCRPSSAAPARSFL